VGDEHQSVKVELNLSAPPAADFAVRGPSGSGFAIWREKITALLPSWTNFLTFEQARLSLRGEHGLAVPIARAKFSKAKRLP
jgi:ABC-type iron transport system FetAB ATPase subunit